MKLLTKAIEKEFPMIGETDGKDPKEIKVIAKFFHCLGRYTFYATEYSPEERKFFGYVKSPLGVEFDELGYQSLDELESVEVRGITMERDRYFGRKHTLAEVMETEKII